MKVVNYILNIRRSILIFFGILTVSAGCKKFVQIGPPTTQLATASVFGTSAAATSAQIEIYIAMWSESWNMASATGLLGDELTNYSTSLTPRQYYLNGMTAANGPGPWRNAYNYIYQANSIITNLQNNSSIPTPIATQLIGESKFARAFWHFYLTNLYGDVPLVLTTNYSVNGSMSRIPQSQVYRQVVADLKDAISELNPNYVGVSDTATTSDRVRPNVAAASAMLARVYLYTQKYDSAEAQASIVINNSALYSLCKNLNKADGANYVFQRSSTEAILQIATPIPNNWFTPDGYGFYLTGKPSSTSTVGYTTISPQLLNSFEPNDSRKAKWIGVYTTSGSNPVKYYFPYKYQSYNTPALNASVNITEYVMILRLAEQYLIRAEARAQQGNLNGAITDLNTIRNRAGLANYSGTMDQPSVISAILHERQVELFTEWGHRWLDLKRTGNLDAVMGGASGVCKAKGGTWNSTSALYPVPQSERNNNANLAQNNGY